MNRNREVVRVDVRKCKSQPQKVMMKKVGHYAALTVLVNHRRQILAKRLIQMSVRKCPFGTDILGLFLSVTGGNRELSLSFSNSHD